MKILLILLAIAKKYILLYVYSIFCSLLCDELKIWPRKTDFSPPEPVPVIMVGFCGCAFCFSYFDVDLVLYYHVHVPCTNNNIFGKINYTQVCAIHIHVL